MLLVAMALTLGSLVWDRGTAKFVDQLGASTNLRARHAVTPKHVINDDLAGLPEPVLRYFAFALKPGQPFIRRAHVQQTGMFARARERWAPFSAEQHYIVCPPGFVWDARIRMAPLVTARVRDSYFARQGTMQGALCGVIPIVSQRGTPEVNAASLQRYLAETPWFPTALLPHAGVTWSPIDDHAARATLADGDVSVWIDFHFGEHGEIVRTATERYRDVNGKPVLTPWIGHFAEYERVRGMMVPRAGEVGWELPDGRFTYWRGHVGIAVYEY